MSKIPSKEVSKEVSNNILLDNLLKIYLKNKFELEQNQNPELEVKFGTRGIKPITKINFDNVIKQLLANNFKFHGESKYYLRISSDTIRTEIIGLKNIQEYCKTNKLPSEITHEGYNFTEKKLYNMGEGGARATVNFDDFNFRVSYNIETSLSQNNPVIENLLKTWSDNKKFYRLINRFTMKHDEYPVLIDLSVVRESNKGSNKYNLKESNIFSQNLKYEIEIELDNNMIDTVDKSLLTSTLLERLIKKITKYILSGLQETNYPISYTEQNLVLNNYLQLVKKQQYRGDHSISPRDFIGPSSSTLQMINIAPVNEDAKIVNIRNNYTVTDKADGDRKMLYISSSGKIYLITTLMNVEFTGAETNNKDLFNSLLDGEHIKHNKTGQFINLYAAFDIYFIGGNDVRTLEFFPLQVDYVPTKFRLPILTNLVNNLESVLVNTKNLPPIRIDKKRFYEVNDEQSIFVGCNTIQQGIKDGLYEYDTDGLIFTPTNLGVGIS